MDKNSGLRLINRCVYLARPRKQLLTVNGLQKSLNCSLKIIHNEKIEQAFRPNEELVCYLAKKRIAEWYEQEAKTALKKRNAKNSTLLGIMISKVVSQSSNDSFGFSNRVKANKGNSLFCERQSTEHDLKYYAQRHISKVASFGGS